MQDHQALIHWPGIHRPWMEEQGTSSDVLDHQVLNVAASIHRRSPHKNSRVYLYYNSKREAEDDYVTVSVVCRICSMTIVTRIGVWHILYMR
jgi:hypothetical protein